MARIRTIKPEFFLHEDLAELSALHRLLFIGLWTLADKEGRIEFRPKRIKAALLPWEDCDIEQLLRDLDDAGFVRIYEVDGVVVLWIPSFQKHQRPHPKEAASDLPPPPPEAMSREIPRQAVKRSATIPSSPGGREGKEISDKGKEISENAVRETSRPAPPPPSRPPPEAPGLGERMGAAFVDLRGAEYQPSQQDELALRALLRQANGDEDEIVRRYRLGLQRQRFPLVTTWVDLMRNWNACATAEPAATSPPPKAKAEPKPNPNRPVGVVPNLF